jgi:VWFA-related protein
MACPSLRLIQLLAFSASLTLPSIAQNPAPQSQPQPAASQASLNQAARPGYTLQTTTRMVTLEVVAEDSKHQHLDGLRASDFQIIEQTPSRSGEKREQKIVDFREVHVADLAPASVVNHATPGVYSNAVALQRDPVPPTILLVDGLNTPLEHQAQVHVQMLKMLRQLPANVPVAVFLLGDRLVMLQSFTSDPKLLQTALSRVTTPAGVGIATVQPQNDPDSMGGLSGTVENDPTTQQLVAAAQSFDQVMYSVEMDERVIRTANALESIARNVAGYPGRKNLLWLSTAFPITVDPFGDIQRLYIEQLKRVNAALSDAKVTVYPINVAGVTTAYQSPIGPLGGSGGTAQIPDLMEQDEHDTMQVLAEGTGGKICTGDNDLGDCVHKAVDDSSDFYEISYYPDSPYWNGEFRNISVKTEAHGAHLAYREGYFANPEGSPDPKLRAAQLQIDCNDYLDATEIPFTAMSLPADAPDQLKFSLLVDATALSLPPTADGSHQLDLDVAVCTYNEKLWPLKVMDYPVNIKLSQQKFETAMSTGKLADTIRVPGPKPVAVRLLVKDVASGRLGSIFIKTDNAVAAANADRGTPKSKQ